jgi:hypothetical protein
MWGAGEFRPLLLLQLSLPPVCSPAPLAASRQAWEAGEVWPPLLLVCSQPLAPLLTLVEQQRGIAPQLLQACGKGQRGSGVGVGVEG